MKSAPYGLLLHVALGASLPGGEVSVASLKLHLTDVTAVSDRASDDPRARQSASDVSFGDTVDAILPSAPPGTYSAVSWTLGDPVQSGVDLSGALGGLSLHLQLSSGPLDVRCPDPQTMAPGQRVQLTLSADASGWFDGVDLSSAKNDNDDNGFIINMEDNSVLAFEILKNVIKSFQLKCEPW
jgi:hypothetical protein